MTRERYNADYSMPDFYKHYIESLDKYELGSVYHLSKKDYNKYLSEMNEKAIESAIHGNTVKFPYRMGDLYIGKSIKKPRLLPDGSLDKRTVAIDYGATNKMWKENPELRAKAVFAYHSNEHSDKYIFKWIWDSRFSNFKNRTRYKFVTVRKAKRKLAKEVKKPGNTFDYYELTNR